MRLPFSFGWCLAFVSLLLASRAEAIDRSLQVSQYGHSTWRLVDGVFPGIPLVLAQSRDGYLWVGTTGGLLRFDGVRFVNFADIEGGRPLPSNVVTALFGSKDGTLWIGTQAGLARWANRTLTAAAYPTDLLPIRLIDAADGEVWISNYDRMARRKAASALCRAGASAVRCFSVVDGLDYGENVSAAGLSVDADGSLLLGTGSSILRWRPGGTSKAIELAGARPTRQSSVIDIAGDRDGNFWVGVQENGAVRGLMQLKGDVLSPVRIGTLDGLSLSVSCLLVDKDGALWVGTDGHGIWHIAGNRADHYGSAEGLAGDDVSDLFEDVEGNVWAASTSGLDMFRILPVVSIGKREGLAADHVDTIMASRNGELWATSGNSINIIGAESIRSIANDDVPGQQITTLFEDRGGEKWAGVDEGLYAFKGNRFAEIRRRDGRAIGRVMSMAQNTDGSVLALTTSPDRQLFRLEHGSVVEETLLPDSPVARTLASGSSGIWLGLVTGDFAKYGDRAFAQIIAFDHRSDSFVQRMTVEADGVVYGTTRIGLAAWNKGRKQMLARRNGLPCDYLYTHILDDHGDIWMLGDCGLMHVSAAEIRAWWEDANRVVAVTRYDMLDGVQPGFVPFVASTKTTDGRLWFTNSAAVMTIHPDRIPVNSVVPTAIVERITANGTTHAANDGLMLGPILHNLQIDYTATSLSIPQRVRFRYKLRGKDDEWTEAGARRQAFYNDLIPGSYTFEVASSNSDGLWNAVATPFRFISSQPGIKPLRSAL